MQTTKVKSGVGFARTLADLLVPVPFCVITLETEEVSLLFSVAICCTDIFGFAVQRVPCVLTFFFDYFFFNIKRTASFFFFWISVVCSLYKPLSRGCEGWDRDFIHTFNKETVNMMKDKTDSVTCSPSSKLTEKSAPVSSRIFFLFAPLSVVADSFFFLYPPTCYIRHLSLVCLWLNALFLIDCQFWILSGANS